MSDIQLFSIALAVLVSGSLVIYLWRYLGFMKTIFLIIAITLVDADHFLFGSKGFLEIPKNGEKILHAFHYCIEFMFILFFLNIITGRHTYKFGIKEWLFPLEHHYASRMYYLFAWALRIILLGVFVHYALDLPIYTLNNKWSYYDYSIIHYYFFS